MGNSQKIESVRIAATAVVPSGHGRLLMHAQLAASCGWLQHRDLKRLRLHTSHCSQTLVRSTGVVAVKAADIYLDCGKWLSSAAH